jgi:hypothetical protein
MVSMRIGRSTVEPISDAGDGLGGDERVSGSSGTDRHPPLDTSHGPRTNSNDLHHLGNAMTGAQLLPNGVLDLSSNRGATQLLALLSDTVQASDDPRSDHLAMLLTTIKPVGHRSLSPLILSKRTRVARHSSSF